jgi:hypothetical protein
MLVRACSGRTRHDFISAEIFGLQDVSGWQLSKRIPKS